MVQMRNAALAVPVVQLVMGQKQQKQQSRPPKQSRNNSATVDDFEREHMGIAAKE